MSATYFAGCLLAQMRSIDPRAAGLRAVAADRADKTAVIGIDDEGEFVPLLKLTGASASFNVMSVLVQHHGQWRPTFKRGTPKTLAEPFTGELQHLWTIPLEMANLDLDELSERG